MVDWYSYGILLKINVSFFFFLKRFILLSTDLLLCCAREPEAFASCVFTTAHCFPKWQQEHRYETHDTDIDLLDGT